MTRIEIGRIYVSRIRKFGALVIGCRYSVVVAGVFLGCPGLFLVSVEYVINRVTRLFVLCEHIYHMRLAAGAFVFVSLHNGSQ